MAKRKTAAVITPLAAPSDDRNFRLFFSGCRNLAAVYDLRLTLALGSKIRVDNIATDTLPCVILLTAVAADLVDDYTILLDRAEEEFKAAVPGFWHPHLFVVASLMERNTTPSEAAEHPELQYLWSVYRQLTAPEAKAGFRLNELK